MGVVTETVGLRHLEYRKRAAECRQNADKTKSAAARAFFLDAEIRWLSIAASYESQEQRQLRLARTDDERSHFVATS